jgi:hypothetical protein
MENKVYGTALNDFYFLLLEFKENFNSFANKMTTVKVSPFLSGFVERPSIDV